jgi:hypothetical protein
MGDPLVSLTAAFGPEDICSIVCRYFEIEPDELIQCKGTARNMSIHLMKRHAGMMNREIVAYFGDMSYSGVSKAEASLLEKATKRYEVKKNDPSDLSAMFDLRGWNPKHTLGTIRKLCC